MCRDPPHGFLKGELMMGHKTPLKSGDEYDALTPWKRFEIWRAGDRKKIKRRFNKRVRRDTLADIRETAYDGIDRYSLFDGLFR